MGKTGEKLEITKDGLLLGGKPFYLASGDMHYFRFFKEGWERRLRLMKDFGLTAVQTYVPWNLHEPEKGEFNFDGNLNIKEFLELCQKIGIKVMFRPSGYMCSEWDFGGLPYWLLNDADMTLRTLGGTFFEHLKSYYKRLAPEFIPYLSTNGGPIIAVAVENEYGSFADDTDYVKAVGDLLKELGVDVPLYTANGVEPDKMTNGSRKEYWTAIDCHELSDKAIADYTAYQNDKPFFAAEFWAGRSQQWGGYFSRQTAESVAEKYKELLQKNTFVNFYMFCGGTNFGFQNGALVGRFGADLPGAKNRFIPFATSYDVDAPVTESGIPTEKYFACKKVLKEYLAKKGFENSATDDTAVPSYVPKAQKIEEITLTKSADFLDNAENLAAVIKKSGMPLTFEKLNQAYGFVLYTTFAHYTDNKKRRLHIEGLHDRAIVFGNGEYLGTLMRDRDTKPIEFYIPESGLKLDILVESMGRVNYGLAMHTEYKGILNFVKLHVMEDDGSLYPWDYSVKACWKNYSLPLKDISKIDFTKPKKDNHPAFYKGEFSAQAGVDTFVDMRKAKKGVVWINGFNLGRYWEIGPQQTLYVPGELLKDKNEIVVLELENDGRDMKVSFSDTAMLDGIDEVKGVVESVVG